MVGEVWWCTFTATGSEYLCDGQWWNGLLLFFACTFLCVFPSLPLLFVFPLEGGENFYSVFHPDWILCCGRLLLWWGVCPSLHSPTSTRLLPGSIGGPGPGRDVRQTFDILRNERKGPAEWFNHSHQYKNHCSFGLCPLAWQSTGNRCRWVTNNMFTHPKIAVQVNLKSWISQSHQAI